MSKPFSCPECGRDLKTDHGLIRHMEVSQDALRGVDWIHGRETIGEGGKVNDSKSI